MKRQERDQVKPRPTVDAATQDMIDEIVRLGSPDPIAEIQEKHSEWIGDSVYVSTFVRCQLESARWWAAHREAKAARRDAAVRVPSTGLIRGALENRQNRLRPEPGRPTLTEIMDARKDGTR